MMAQMAHMAQVSKLYAMAASEVLRDHQAAIIQASSVATVIQPPLEWHEGSLKSLNTRTSFGFIACKETYKVYTKDIYVLAEQLPKGCKIGDRFRFTVELEEKKKHPQARDVTPL